MMILMLDILVKGIWNENLHDFTFNRPQLRCRRHCSAVRAHQIVPGRLNVCRAHLSWLGASILLGASICRAHQFCRAHQLCRAHQSMRGASNYAGRIKVCLAHQIAPGVTDWTKIGFHNIGLEHDGQFILLEICGFVYMVSSHGLGKMGCWTSFIIDGVHYRFCFWAFFAWKMNDLLGCITFGLLGFSLGLAKLKVWKAKYNLHMAGLVWTWIYLIGMLVCFTFI